MDSTSLLLRLLADGCQVYGISFDYGQKHRIELERLQNNLDYFSERDLSIQWECVDLRELGRLFHSALTDPDWEVPSGHYEQANMKATVVPNRNAIFASIAYGHALSIAIRHACHVRIALGVHGGDHAIYPDCRPEFYQAIHRAFSLGNWESERVTLELPYLTKSKSDILSDACRAIDELKLDFDTVFRNTCTSYMPDAMGRASGLTGSDVERVLAFHELGLVDPVPYQESWEAVVTRALQIKSDFDRNAASE